MLSWRVPVECDWPTAELMRRGQDNKQCQNHLRERVKLRWQVNLRWRVELRWQVDLFSVQICWIGRPLSRRF